MNLSSLIGVNVKDPIDAIGNAFDKIFTSDEERSQAQAVLEKLKQHPGELQVELNKLEAGHRSILVAAWRPFIGWVCGLAMFNYFLINPWLQWITGNPGPDLSPKFLFELVIAMLGMSGLRTFEKIKGRAK